MKRAPVIVATLVAILLLATSLPTLARQPIGAQASIQGQWFTIANGDDIRGLAMTGNLVWAGTRYGGVVRWDPFDGSYKQFLAPQTGLAGNDVRAVASQGLFLVSFATNNGVSEYVTDAETWTTYTTANGLPSNNATAVAYAPDGNLWVGTSQIWNGSAWVGGGLSVRLRNGDWVTYTVDDGLPSNNITDIAFAGSDVWVGTIPYKVLEAATDTTEERWVDEGGGVALLTGGQWRVFTRDDTDLPNDRINAVATAPDGRAWFATPAGLAVYDLAEDVWQVYRSRDGLESNKVRDVTVDGNNRVWALTYDSESSPIGVLNVLDGDTWTTYDDEDGLSSKVLWSVLMDDQERLWVGTGPWCKNTSGCQGGGLTQFRPADNAWTVYRMADDYLASNQITDLAMADDGTLWIATAGSGLSMRDPSGAWQHFTMESDDIPSDIIHALAIDEEGAVWIGTQQFVHEGAWTGGGLSVYRDGSWTTYNKENSGLPANEVLTIEIDTDGLLWIGTGDLRDNSGSGLAIFNPATGNWTVSTVDDGLPSNLVNDIAFDANQGVVWVATGPYLVGGATGGGMARLEEGVWTSFTAENSDIPTWHGDNVTGDFHAVAIGGDGTPWAGTWDSQAHPSQVEPYFDAIVTSLSDNEWSRVVFPGQGFISTLAFAPDGTLWAGIGQDGRGSDPRRGGLRARITGTWTAATTATSGLASNDITTLIVAANGDLWVGTANAGLSQLRNAQLGPTITPTPTPTSTPTATRTSTPTLQPSATLMPGQPTPTQPTPTAVAQGPLPTITPLPVTPTPGTAAPPAEVPEAATLILVGTGLAGLGSYAAYRWRRRQGGTG